MSRTTLLKAGYLLVLAALAAAVLGILIAVPEGPARILAGLGVAAVLLVPGRVSGYLFRDLYRSRRALDAGELERAEQSAEAAAEHIRRRPHLKPLLWLTWSAYTTDIEAMALNNLGAARLMRSRIDEAEPSLRRALALDPLYPLPFFNLAAIAWARGDEDEARRLAAESVRLGFSGGTIDRVIQLGQAALAAVEGR